MGLGDRMMHGVAEQHLKNTEIRRRKIEREIQKEIKREGVEGGEKEILIVKE